MYADFKSILRKTTDIWRPQEHLAGGYSYVVVRCDSECMSQKTYRGKNGPKDFIKSLLKEQADINRAFANPLSLLKPVVDSDTCWIFEKPIN